jgi:AcrR family transcriptional regulator
MSASPSGEPRKQARRHATEARIIAAARAILSEEGFDRLGINAVAQRAKVSKELIYRYFGDMTGLVLAAIASRDYWNPEHIAAAGERLAGKPLADKAIALILDQARSLRHDPEQQEIRRWEVGLGNEVAVRLGEGREVAGRMVAELLGDRPDLDPAVFGLLMAGVSFLVLRSKTLGTYLGIDIRSERGWKRWEAAAETIIRKLCEGSAAPRTTPLAGKPGKRRR